MIPQAFLDSLLQRVDLVDLIGQYVPLKKTGANYSGRCPFHSEKSPSFSVAPAKQFYHCFGCGANGNAIKFLMAFSGYTFPQAVELLAGRLGMTVPQDREGQRPPEQVEAEKSRKRLLQDRMLSAAKFYQRRLKDSPEAIRYLKGRGITGETAARFHLGYAPEGWQPLQAVFPDYEDESLVATGLVIHTEDDGRSKRYDRFRNRIMFPILGQTGEVIGFGARAMGDEQPKYLNSPETELFVKGSGLYGLYEARQAIRAAGEIWVVEGYMDVICLAQAGLGHVVATLGTATTSEQAALMLRQASTLCFMFDGDAAGRRAAIKGLEQVLPLMKDGRLIRFVFLPDGHDPDSLVREQGREALEALVSSALTLSSFLLAECARDQDLSIPEGRAAACVRARQLLGLMPESTLRQQIAQTAANQFQTDPGSLLPAQPAEPGPGAGDDPRANEGYGPGPVRSAEGSRRSNRTSGSTSGSTWRSQAPRPELPRGPRPRLASTGQRLLRLAVRRPALLLRLRPEVRAVLSPAESATLDWLLAGPPPGTPPEPVLEQLRLARQPDQGLDEAIQGQDETAIDQEWADTSRQLLMASLQAEARRLASDPNAEGALERLRLVQFEIAQLKSEQASPPATGQGV